MGFQKTKGTCDGRGGRYNHCSRTDVWIDCKSRGQCTVCSGAYKRAKNKPKPLKKFSAKKLEFMETSQDYYIKAILANRKKNGGKCVCDECGVVITHPTGRNVSHIVGCGANKALYHIPENHNILCVFENGCEPKWTDGDKTRMKVFPRSEEIRIKLTAMDYATKPKRR